MPALPTSEPQIIELPAQASIAVRIRLPMAELDLAEVFGTYQPELERVVRDRGLVQAGPAYGRYFEFGPEQVDVEIGLPVASLPADLPNLGTDPPDGIGGSELPAGKAAALLHVGPYDTLGQEYDRLHDWIHEQGRDEGAGPWESYVDDVRNGADLSTLRTEVYWPLG